ncbi:PfkB domain protein [Thalassoporum mexicanum PCC 7367]|uniref:PfkB family carbohydrate kinase n=1 Tax=Thalassoporum mexicanum TaxID=3457544 RepID=UPI00029FEFCD|nr:PfkB family carbohydrate kinase [Pseudanabaena sp. PCC 7367]AFY71173.1 PfkB domain protein [Pseudanabaena sp. PCC 7367]
MHGLFVGLTTLDLIYLAAAPPEPNQKVVAQDHLISGGGPATNAAVAFAHLSSKSKTSEQARGNSNCKLITALGNHELASLISADLGKYGVEIIDLAADRQDPPPMSSIVVSQDTGERSVISVNATGRQIPLTQLARLNFDPLAGVEVVLIDGHQMDISAKIAQMAKTRQIPVVVDGGSWKEGFEQVLKDCDYAICSSNFLPPGCFSEADVCEFLSQLGVRNMAITKGAALINYKSGDRRGEIAVPTVKVIDTLGAGDIFHGAFCYYLAQQNLAAPELDLAIDSAQKFTIALKQASAIAARSCQFFGTRKWMQDD